MKSFFAAFALLLAFNSYSQATQLEHVALCVIEEDEEDTSLVLQQVSLIDIKAAKNLSPFLLKLVNIHLVKEGYALKAMTFQEIKGLFRGEAEYDDLYVITLKSNTGKYYVHVKSWPGDNPYGLFFDMNGELVASMSDGTISLETSAGSVYCMDLAK
ncbi:hypothetical protein D3C87_259840 [compost metagenome]